MNESMGSSLFNLVFLSVSSGRKLNIAAFIQSVTQKDFFPLNFLRSSNCVLKSRYACKVSQVVKLCVTVCISFVVFSRGTRDPLEVSVPKAHRCVIFNAACPSDICHSDHFHPGLNCIAIFFHQLGTSGFGWTDWTSRTERSPSELLRQSYEWHSQKGSCREFNSVFCHRATLD